MPREDFVFLSYCNGNALPEVTRAQAKKLTHLCIAFAVVGPQGNMIIDRYRHWLPYIKDIKGYNPNLQILLSTGGGGERGHGGATRTPEGVKRLVDTCMGLVREFGLDGIDCDWEFPCDTSRMEEKYQYTQLMTAYRQALDEYEKERGKKAWLTAAWAAYSQGFERGVELDKVLPLMDFINVMSYDMNHYGMTYEQRLAMNAGKDVPERPSCPAVATHHSNVYPATGDPRGLSCVSSLEAYRKAGIPDDMFVLGAAFYSKQFNGVPDGGTHGLHQLAQSNCVHGPGYDVIRSAYELNPDYIKYWDDEAKACWLYNGYNFITYEDPRAMAIKARFVVEENIRGIMYWEHHYDATSTLFNVIYDTIYL